VAVASTKKPKAKAGKKRDGKVDQEKGQAASTTAKPKKTASKKAAKKSKHIAKTDSVTRNSVKQRRIRVPDATGQSAADGATVQEPDPFEVAKRTMKGSVPAIVEAMVELAKQGSCSHAKTLLEMTGAKHMFDGEAEAQDGGAPWAKLVLERLDEAESEAVQEAESLPKVTER
jgi:hypothetical protein